MRANLRIIIYPQPHCLWHQQNLNKSAPAIFTTVFQQNDVAFVNCLHARQREKVASHNIGRSREFGKQLISKMPPNALIVAVPSRPITCSGLRRVRLAHSGPCSSHPDR
jgi:hypothetical protein